MILRLDAQPQQGSESSNTPSFPAAAHSDPAADNFECLRIAQVLQASEDGDIDALTESLGKLNVELETKGEDGDTALHLACLYGHTDCVKLILEKGAKVDIKDGDGGLPLHDACAGGYLEIVEMLVEKAPETVHAKDEDGDTPLIHAARGDHLEVVHLLIDKGADPR